MDLYRFHGSETVDDVAKWFVLAIVDMIDKICELLKTINVPIVISVEVVLSRFIDACRFMASNLAKNLRSPDFGKFREVAKMFSPTRDGDATRKTVFIISHH